METLIINIPDEKSLLVKQALKDLGVTIQTKSKINAAEYKKKLAGISVWDENELKLMEEARNAFNSLKPQQW